MKEEPHRNVLITVLLYFCPHHLAPLKQLQFHTSVLSLDHLGFPHQVSKDKKNAHLQHKIGHLLQGPGSLSSDGVTEILNMEFMLGKVIKEFQRKRCSYHKHLQDKYHQTKLGDQH